MPQPCSWLISIGAYGFCSFDPMTEKKPTISSLKREIERLKARAVVLESEVERRDVIIDAKIYKKKGRRYVEVGEYDNEAMHYPHGAHLVVSKPGSKLTRYNIDPAHAAVESALERVRDAMAKAMAKATELTPEKRAHSKKELSAIAAYTAIAGNPIDLRFEGVSMHDVIEAGVRILAAEVLSLNAADAGIKAVMEYRP